MRKLTVLATMLVMMLVAASPAMADTVAVGGDVHGSFDGDGIFDDEFVVFGDDDGFGFGGDSTQIAVSTQVISGDGTLAGAGAAQAIEVDQTQVSSGFGDGIFD